MQQQIFIEMIFMFVTRNFFLLLNLIAKNENFIYNYYCLYLTYYVSSWVPILTKGSSECQRLQKNLLLN